MPLLQSRKYSKPIRKYLRKHACLADAALWKMLKKRRLGGYKFLRHHRMGQYELDFYCPDLLLLVEIERRPNDALSSKCPEHINFMKQNGIKVFSYEHRWIIKYPELIVEDILEFANSKKPVQ